MILHMGCSLLPTQTHRALKFIQQRVQWPVGQQLQFLESMLLNMALRLNVILVHCLCRVN